jgi:hypothetical protein
MFTSCGFISGGLAVVCGVFAGVFSGGVARAAAGVVCVFSGGWVLVVIGALVSAGVVSVGVVNF